MSSVLPEIVEAAEVAVTRSGWFPNALHAIEKFGEKTLNFLSAVDTVVQARKNLTELESSVKKELATAAVTVENAIDGQLHKVDHPSGNALPTAAPSIANHPKAARAHAVVAFGSTGAVVKEVQRDLRIAADGIDGPVTTAAVKAFQQTHGLRPDGIVGAQTWQAINASEHARFPANGVLAIRVDGQGRIAESGYAQSGRILSVQDDVLTQSTGRGRVEYNLRDLIADAKDPAAMLRFLVPGRDIQVSVEPDHVHVAAIERNGDLDRAQRHSR